MPIYDYRPPSPALREYVKRYQILGCEFPVSIVELPVKAYWPRAENCLTFLPRDPEKIENSFDGKLIESTRSRVQGQYSISRNIHVGRDFMVFNVVFQPGGLFRLTGIPLHELTNSFADAEAIFSTEIKLVNERLSYTKYYTEMIDIIENFLLSMVSKSKKQALPIDKISRFLQANPNSASMDWLANQACLSQRQFYRQFIEREGISPKLYARIARFENVMKVKNLNPSKGWPNIAYDFGYYDYQHMVKDFIEFTSITPTAFYNASAKGPEVAFGMRETY